MSEELVHRICQAICEADSGQPHDCLRCPATVDSPYGPGVQGCRLLAEEIIAMVMTPLIGRSDD